MTTPHHLPPPLVMLPSSHPVFLSNVAKHVAHFFITHAGPWAWAIAIKVAQGVLGLAHQLAVACAARCVPFFFFAVLIFLRVNVGFTEAARGLCADVCAGNFFHM